MLTHVEINHFQSLSEISLDLAPFTVIVGPSSSGKSAFTRALHTLIHNRRGTEWITHGERVATITAQNDKGTVSLTRTTSPGDANAYVLIPQGAPTEQQRFTKLGGVVPEDVSAFLGIEPDSGTFAGQHDKPYMLDESGSTVANTLGALTNVSVIFEAAREANRQKLASSGTLKTRADDMERIQERIPGIQALKEQQAALTRAEELLSSATALEQRLSRLVALHETVQVTTAAIESLSTLARISLPDLHPVLTAQQRLDGLLTALGDIQSAQGAVQQATAAVTTYSAQEADTRAEYTAALSGLASEIQAALQQGSSYVVDGTIEVEEASTIVTRFIVTHLS